MSKIPEEPQSLFDDELVVPGQPAAGKAAGPGISLDRLTKALENNEAGDGTLLAEILNGWAAYDHAENIWYLWEGGNWLPDRTRKIVSSVFYPLASLFLEGAAAAQRAGDKNRAEKFISRQGVLCNLYRANNVLTVAAAAPGIALAGDEWDKCQLMLPVMNGVIDLRTGSITENRPGNYIKSFAPTEYQGIDTPAPRWVQFIDEIFPDKELAAFMQRLLGYAISGKITEHILPVFWGEGRNGKGTLLETIADVIGCSLTMSTPADSLMDLKKSGDGPKPFIYSLRGKRLVWASESNEGRRVNAGLVKQLTGGDRLNVRTLHGKPVEFLPTHQIVLITNNKPHINADDQAIWDRILLIPFNARFVDNPKASNERQKDKTLKDKLLGEASGILAWLVRGYLAYQKEGLQPPAIVRAATEQYRNDEDTLGQFIDECCLIGPNLQVKAADLFQEYQNWCADNRISPLSNKPFKDRLGRKGIVSKHTNTGNIYSGCGLLQP